MKFKSILISGLCLAGFAMTSCDDQEDSKYSPAADVESPVAYFSPGTATSLEIKKATETEFTLPVYRATAGEALTVGLECTVSATGFNVPSTVTFDADETESTIVVTYNSSDLVVGDPYIFDFKFGDGANTPYALQSFTYQVTYDPWEVVVGARGSKTGKWVDDMICTWYGLPSGETWDITIQKSLATSGLYRVVNPYIGLYKSADYQDAFAGYDSSVEHYLYFNAADPNCVYFCDAKGNAINADGSFFYFTSGLTIAADGQWQLSGKYNLAIYQKLTAEQAAPFAGTLIDGVVKFPANSIMIGESEYNGGLAQLQGAWGNASGAFRIIFPDCKDDPAAVPSEWESVGSADFTDPWFYPLFGEATPQTWEVAVEQNVAKGDVFRLVNPYKAGICPDGVDYDGDLYFEFDATVTNCVIAEPTFLGVDDDGDNMYFGNLAGVYALVGGWTTDQIINQGYNATSYDESNHEIVISAGDAKLMYLENEDLKLKIYTPNIKIQGVIAMKGEAAAAAKKAQMSMNYTSAFDRTLKANGLANSLSLKSNAHVGKRAYKKFEMSLSK